MAGSNLWHIPNYLKDVLVVPRKLVAMESEGHGALLRSYRLMRVASGLECNSRY